jgi:hypothetical protein
MDFKTIKDKNHYIYDSIDEFHIHNPDIPVRHYWRDGCEGEWVFTDDDFVCQILRKNTVKSGNNDQDCVRTVCGTFVCSYMDRRMLGENGIAENIYSFSGNFDSAGSYVKNDLSSHEKIFARYIANGTGIVEAFKKVYPDASSDRYIREKSTRLIKKESVQKMIKQEIQEILNEEGVTHKWLIERYKTVADLAENDNAKLRSLDSLAKISGLFDQDEKKSEQITVWAGFSPEVLKEAEKHGKPKLIAHAEREED